MFEIATPQFNFQQKKEMIQYNIQRINSIAVYEM